MIRFQRIVLAGIFGLCGAIVLSYMPKELIANSQVIMESPAQVISSESTENNAVEVNGVRFEILVPERVWMIPSKEPDAETPVKISMRITNNTQQPLRFTRFDSIFPEILKPDGTELQRDGGRNWTSMPMVSDCPLLQPGESTIFTLDTRLFWRNNKLKLGGSDGFGGIWYFDDLKLGIYQIGIGYGVSLDPKPLWVYDPEIKTSKPLTDLWRVSVSTPLVEIRLVQN